MIKARTFAAAAVIAVAPLMLSATQAFAQTGPDTSSADVSASANISSGTSTDTSSGTSADTSSGTSAGTSSGTSADTSSGMGTFFDQTQTLAGQQATFIQGGDDLGRGAGELVSAAYIGAPQAILDIPAQVLGIPKPLLYLP